MPSHLDEQSLVRANAQFWEQMLGMQMDTVPFAEEFCVDPGHVLVSVGLFGNWNGRIEVRMARNLADMATAAMLMQPVEAVVEADTLDATREIVNMIGGLLKSCAAAAVLHDGSRVGDCDGQALFGAAWRKHAHGGFSSRSGRAAGTGARRKGCELKRTSQRARVLFTRASWPRYKLIASKFENLFAYNRRPSE